MNRNLAPYAVFITLLSCLLIATAHPAEPDGFVKPDSRWERAQYLQARPADARPANVNPPRFSWPYVPGSVVQPSQREVPLATFTFQIAASPSMQNPIVDIETPWNFYNTLAPLPAGTWHWRVGYRSDGERRVSTWSPIRSFVVTEETPVWDRSGYSKYLEALAKRPHPRLMPEGGTWFGGDDPRDRDRARVRQVTLRFADEALAKPWVRNMPATDVIPRSAGRTERSQFHGIARDIALCATAWHYTNDRKYLAVIPSLLTLASYPPGEASSPETHGGDNKFMTQITEFMAVAYDLLYHELDESQRAAIRDSIRWRLVKSMNVRLSFLGRTGMLREGVAITALSHPFQNFMWNVAPTLLTYGEIPETMVYAEPMLHYLVGVSGADGQEEGYNEGPFYALEKTETMLRAMLYTQILMPDTVMGRNPYLPRLGEWISHLLPVGITRLPFGNITAGDQSYFDAMAWPGSANHAQTLAWLTGDGRFMHRYDAADAYARELGLYNAWSVPLLRDPWLHVPVSRALPKPEPVPDPATSRFFPVSGWAMLSNRTPSDRAGWEEAVGMIFQMRPRGGYSHSFRSDGTFTWYAYGKVLSAGGGTMLKGNTHTISSHPHNVIHIDGVGQEYDAHLIETPWVARPLYYKDMPDHIHVVGDMSLAYPGTNLQRWHRHVLYLGEAVFVILDDLEASRPSRFSWRFNIHTDADLQLETSPLGFHWKEGEVSARVILANDPRAFELQNLQGRDGFKNPITGEDHTGKITQMAERLNMRLRGQRDYAGGDIIDRDMSRHNLWVTNTRPVRSTLFLSVLTAAPKGGTPPRVDVLSQESVRIGVGDASWVVDAGSRARNADIRIDLPAFRNFARETAPTR